MVAAPSLSLHLPHILPPPADMGGSLWGVPTPKRYPEVPVHARAAQGLQSQGAASGKCSLLLIQGHSAAAVPLALPEVLDHRGDTAVTSLFQPGLGAVPG